MITLPKFEPVAKFTTARLRRPAFACPGQHRRALADVNVAIPAGKTLALVGTSGTGNPATADVASILFLICFHHYCIQNTNIGAAESLADLLAGQAAASLL